LLPESGRGGHTAGCNCNEDEPCHWARNLESFKQSKNLRTSVPSLHPAKTASTVLIFSAIYLVAEIFAIFRTIAMHCLGKLSSWLLRIDKLRFAVGAAHKSVAAMLCIIEE
jgi:hypothetical protein